MALEAPRRISRSSGDREHPAPSVGRAIWRGCPPDPAEPLGYPPDADPSHGLQRAALQRPVVRQHPPPKTPRSLSDDCRLHLLLDRSYATPPWRDHSGSGTRSGGVGGPDRGAVKISLGGLPRLLDSLLLDSFMGRCRRSGLRKMVPRGIAALLRMRHSFVGALS